MPRLQHIWTGSTKKSGDNSLLRAVLDPRHTGRHTTVSSSHFFNFLSTSSKSPDLHSIASQGRADVLKGCVPRQILPFLGAFLPQRVVRTYQIVLSLVSTEH